MIPVVLAFVLSSHSSQAVVITIDATNKTPISHYIYGANFIDWKRMTLPFTFDRQGGNRMSAYNWETNASNAGNDFHHQNDGYMGATEEPASNHLSILKDAQTHGAAVLLTVPTLGYVSADKKGDGDVGNTPNYLETRFLKSLPSKPGAFEDPPNTKDKFVYQDELVWYLEKRKAKNTPVWYSLDNEPDLWSNTHARICKTTPTYQEIIQNNVSFASAIKKVAPNTLVFGPANYGWYGFRRFQGASDNNNRDFLDVYLSAMRLTEKSAGKRLLDVLDIHWYPEARGDGVRITDSGEKPATAEARMQAPRSLWDETYVEDSWITKDFLKGRPIALLPNIQKQIKEHYPGTKFAITEYNYGGAKSISGAIAQADALGLFGRYGLFAASNWGVGPDDVGTLAGFRVFLDFDGHGKKFGDLGLPVAGLSAETGSAYAALDAKNPKRMTVIVLNKTDNGMLLRMSAPGFRAKSVAGYAFGSSNLSKPAAIPSRIEGTAMLSQLPAMSLCAFELRQ